DWSSDVCSSDLAVGEGVAVGVLPVPAHRRGLRGVHVHAEVAQFLVAGQGAEQGGAGGEVHGLRGGLLVVAGGEAGVAGGPAVPRVGGEGPHPGEALVAAVGVVGVPQHRLDHRPPPVPADPGPVVAGDRGRRGDEVAVVEVVVVEFGVGAEAGGEADQGVPLIVVVELGAVGGAVGGQPVLHPAQIGRAHV